MKLKRAEKYINIFLFIVFISAAYLSIKYSDAPLFIHGKFVDDFFGHKKEIDSVLCGILTGYITGYIIYFLTVMFPLFIRRAPYKKDTTEILLDMYICAITTLLIVYKKVCYEKEWNELKGKKDIEVLQHPQFINRMGRLDVYSEAYTIYGNKETNKRKNWCEYFESVCERLRREAVELLVNYGSYLDYDTIDLLLEIKKSHFIGMMTGNDQGVDNVIVTEDGLTYFDGISAGMYYASNGKGSPIFAIEKNKIRLKEFIELLFKMRKIVRKNIKNSDFDRSVMTKLWKYNTGETGSSIFEYSKTINK